MSYGFKIILALITIYVYKTLNILEKSPLEIIIFTLMTIFLLLIIYNSQAYD